MPCCYLSENKQINKQKKESKYNLSVISAKQLVYAGAQIAASHCGSAEGMWNSSKTLNSGFE